VADFLRRSDAPVNGDHGRVQRFLQFLEGKSVGGSMVFPAFGGGAYGYNGLPAWGNANGSWFSYYLPGAKYDYAAEAGDLWRNSAVAACLGWISDNFSEPTLEVVRKKRGGNEEILDALGHPAPALLCEPNPDYDADALWAATILSFVISGNAYWIKAKAPSGKKMWLYWVPYWEIEPRWNPSGGQFIDHYDHVVDGKRYPLRKDQIVHFRRGLNPTNVRSGLPMLEPVLREICTDNSAAGYTAGICRNWGVPRVLIMPEGDNANISPDEQDNIRDMFVERTTGENVGAPLVNNVKLKVVELSAKPSDMALDKLREVPESRICAVMKIPPMVVGLGVGDKQKTYSNLATAERMAYRNCLVPLQKCFARALNRQLLPDLGDPSKEVLRWNYSNVEALQEEAMSVANRTVLLVKAGLMSKEEGRAKNGLGEAKPTDTFAPLGGAKSSPGGGADAGDGTDDPAVAEGKSRKRRRRREREDDDDPFGLM
jgi:HK97 family phage portal protein